LKQNTIKGIHIHQQSEDDYGSYPVSNSGNKDGCRVTLSFRLYPVLRFIMWKDIHPSLNRAL